MKKAILLWLLLNPIISKAQIIETKPPKLNIRLSFLVFPPFSPLLTLETSTFGNLTFQIETNFVNTHGINVKYFLSESMNEHFVFIGNAFIESDNLRKDKQLTFLPYGGYGYAYRFGKSKTWILDSRLGIGRTTNADDNLILPVLKTGIGLTF